MFMVKTVGVITIFSVVLGASAAVAQPAVPPVKRLMPPAPSVAARASAASESATSSGIGVASGEELLASTLSVYTPPACVPGVPFADITCTTGFDPWIEQFGLDGITSGCGGGNYCPGTPVTRDQMAVFIEHAMRGTSNWPPHTVLVHHHQAGETNSNVHAGTELLSMVAAIPSSGSEAPSASNPWLIRLGPGIYDLGSGSLTLPVYTALEGAGQDITMITATGYADEVHGSVIMGDHGKLSHLTVNNSGGNTYEVAVYLPSPATSVALDHLTITASNPSNSSGDAVGLFADANTSFSLIDAEVTVHNAHNIGGVAANSSTDESRLEGVHVKVYGSNLTGASGGFVGNAATSVIINSRFDVASGAYQAGLYAQGAGGTLELRNSEVHVSGGGLNVSAVYISDVSATLLGNLLSSQQYGVQTAGSGLSVDISKCDITGGTNWLKNGSGFTVTVGASKLVGTTNNSAGTVNCFGNFTGSAFLANTCP